MTRHDGNNPSPFEVMSTSSALAGHHRGKGPTPPTPHLAPSDTITTPTQDNVPRPPATAPGVSDGWWERAKHPVVLRLPQGYVVVFGLGIIGLICLAYWVGQSRGYKTARGLVPADPASVALSTPMGPAAVTAGPGRGDHGAGNSTPLAPLVHTDREADPRQVGMNYLVLAHYPLQDAQRLVVFLREHGVAATAFQMQNKSLYQVVALHGFFKDQIRGSEHSRLMHRLRELGRAWKSQHLGPDFSKSGIYLDLFEGKTGR